VGLGAVAGSIVLGAAGDIRNKSRLIVISGSLFCLSIIAFALTSNFTLALVFLALSGLVDIAFGTAKQTVIQMLAEHRYLGRVMSLNSISQRGIGQASGFQAGTMATFIGVQSATAIGAGICLTALLGSRLFFPRAWRFADAPAREPEAGLTRR
jgi:MFS family permease